MSTSKSNTYVGIDASITSTAVCIEQDGIDRYLCFTTAPKLNGWMKFLEPVVDFTLVHYDYPKDYSESECYKLVNYSKTATAITTILPDCATIGMEAYSQSSDAGHLIDLVTIGTFIRMGILAAGWDLNLYAPMTMKKQTCRIAYNKWDVKKKVWRNMEEVAGGSFKKHEMLKAMLDSNIKSSLSDILRERSSDILSLKAIPKPIDDLVDAFWAKEIAKQTLQSKISSDT
jgi:hypothetical protein